MKIEKKILHEYFELVLSDKKKYDLRLADFDSKERDILVLKEWDKETQSFTGREIEKNVLYVGKTKGDTTWSQADIDEYGYQSYHSIRIYQ